MPNSNKPIPVYRINTDTPYETVAARQEDMVNNSEEGLLLCEHPATITLGTSTEPSDLMHDVSYYAKKGFTVHKSPRGGQVTYHGPGQIVAYPVINIRKRGWDVNRHLRFLESLLIQTCSYYDIKAEAIAGKAGAWIGERKIGFLGIRVRRGFCFHGLSLNVLPQHDPFSTFVPCGFNQLHVTSIHEESPHTPTVWDVADIIETYTFEALINKTREIHIC